MLGLKKIAITGGIASGKTTVCHILEKHGALTLSSDQIIHRLLKTDRKCIDKTLELLGKTVLTAGTIDRQKVAAIVFDNKEKLRALEKTLHPRLIECIEEHYQQAKAAEKWALFAVEAPLVQEMGIENQFDSIVAVTTSEEKALARYKATRGTEQEYRKRMSYQWEGQKKAENADYVVTNNKTIGALEVATVEMMKEISSQ